MRIRRTTLAFSLSVLFALSSLCNGQQSDPDVVRISSTLVRIDILATDKDGRMVRDLRPEDIEVYENGSPQKVVSLSLVSEQGRAVATGITSTSSTNGQTNSGTVGSTSTSRPGSASQNRLLVVVDDLTLSAESVTSVRKALQEFVDARFKVGDAIGIMMLSQVREPVVRFYTTKPLIDDVIAKIGWYSGSSGEAVAIPPTDPDLGLVPHVTSADGRTLRSNYGSLGALEYILAALKVVPGRVPLIYFSDGFNIPKNDDPRVDRNMILDPLNKLIDTANRQATSFYTVDARGLLVSGIRASDTMPSNPTASPAKALADTLNLIKQRQAQIDRPQDGLDYLAQSTGGIAYRNRNDISSALDQAVDDRSYYLLAYAPSADDFNPKILKMNKIHLTAKRKGVRLRYRTAFSNRQ